MIREVASASATTAVERLVAFLLDDAGTDALALEVNGWLTASRRFRAFADAHRDKIRKKLRRASDAEARRDVRTELRVASLLLAERAVELAFEASGPAGGPDFTIAMAGQRPVNLEVTRLRRPPEPEHIGRAVLAKLRQLPPGVPNVLLLATETGGVRPGAPEAAIWALRARADAKDEAFFARHGFVGGRGFYDRFLRLGAILVWAEGAADPLVPWENRSARIAVPPRTWRAIMAGLEGARVGRRGMC